MTVPPETIAAAAIRRAISDPGSITPRIHGEETVTEWQIRALNLAAVPAIAAAERERCARLAETHAAVWRDPAAKDTTGRRGAYVPFAGILRRGGAT